MPSPDFWLNRLPVVKISTRPKVALQEQQNVKGYATDRQVPLRTTLEGQFIEPGIRMKIRAGRPLRTA